LELLVYRSLPCFFSTPSRCGLPSISGGDFSLSFAFTSGGLLFSKCSSLPFAQGGFARFFFPFDVRGAPFAGLGPFDLRHLERQRPPGLPGIRMPPGRRKIVIKMRLDKVLGRAETFFIQFAEPVLGLGLARFRMSAQIRRGSSGGPLLNSRGVLIGIATAGLQMKGGAAITFGTKISAASMILNQATIPTIYDVDVREKKVMAPHEIFQAYHPFVVLIEVR
jgi:hypothetical protein